MDRERKARGQQRPTPTPTPTTPRAAGGGRPSAAAAAGAGDERLLREAQEWKERGNRLFASQAWEDAVGCYRRALAALPPDAAAQPQPQAGHEEEEGGAAKARQLCSFAFSLLRTCRNARLRDVECGKSGC